MTGRGGLGVLDQGCSKIEVDDSVDLGTKSGIDPIRPGGDELSVGRDI